MPSRTCPCASFFSFFFYFPEILNGSALLTTITLFIYTRPWITFVTERNEHEKKSIAKVKTFNLSQKYQIQQLSYRKMLSHDGLS